MKKAISLLMALIMCLSLCGCGGSGTSEHPYEKYEELFLYLEADDYESANAYIQEFFGVAPDTNAVPQTEPVSTEEQTVWSEPTENEPEYKTIEISQDNWQEYFELKTVIVTHKNAFDEIDYFFPQLTFQLKDEWKAITADMDVVFEYSCTDSYACWFTYDSDTGEAVEGEKTDDYVSDPWGTIRTLDKNDIEYGTWLYGNSKRNTLILEGNIARIVVDMYATVEILRIQGTIIVTE